MTFRLGLSDAQETQGERREGCLDDAVGCDEGESVGDVEGDENRVKRAAAGRVITRPAEFARGSNSAIINASSRVVSHVIDSSLLFSVPSSAADLDRWPPSANSQGMCTAHGLGSPVMLPYDIVDVLLRNSSTLY